MVSESVLVVEDDEDIREMITYNLHREKYRVTGAGSGEEALRAVAKAQPDLILLDLMLPGMDGYKVCRLLKADESTSDIPVVMLTAKGEEADIVAGLDAGADDYITKPFSPKVLQARVRAVLRRIQSERNPDPTPGADPDVLQRQNIWLHQGRREVRVDGTPVDLTRTEFDLLHYLMQRPGWVFTRKQMLRAIHGELYSITDRAVDVQVVGMRRKLGSAGSHVETVRGVGYRFKEAQSD